MSALLPTNSRVTSGDLNSVARYSEVLPLYFLPFASASACSRRLATKIWFCNAKMCNAVHRNHYSHSPAFYLATINQPFQYCHPTLPQGNCQRVSNQFPSAKKRYLFPSFILFCSTQICNPCQSWNPSSTNLRSLPRFEIYLPQFVIILPKLKIPKAALFVIPLTPICNS